MKKSLACCLQLVLFTSFTLSVAVAFFADAVAADSRTPPSQTAPTTLQDAAKASWKSDEPCRAASSNVTPEYPLPVYTTSQIATMLKRPANVPDLLWNLKLVFDDKLLAQPNFFQDEVLLKLFNGTEIRWFEPGTPDIAGDRLIRPTRVARITVGDTFTGMKVDVGLNHKCLGQRPTRADPKAMIPPHTYDSGYIRLRVPPLEGLTLGAVRKIFGPNPGSFDDRCKNPLPLSYPTITEPDSAAFFLNSAEFRPDDIGYEALCEASSARELPDEDLVGTVSIRLMEDDHTIRLMDQPGAAVSVEP